MERSEIRDRLHERNPDFAIADAKEASAFLRTAA
jgi:hypothetical protein